MNESLVSVVMPAYNCEKFINQSIESVLAQTYTNWELIVVDDCSSDNTVGIVESYAEVDSRIKLFSLSRNGGPAAARNKAIEVSTGDYIAFLDSDDLWMPDKLEKQISFMEENKYNLTATAYSQILEDGTSNGYAVYPYKKASYNKVLYSGNPLGNSTVVFCAKRIGKFYVPEIKKRNDFALWLRILKTEKYAYGIQDILSKYRIRECSVSSGKKSLIKYQWYLYRHIEKLNIFKCIMAFVTLAYHWTLKPNKRKSGERNESNSHKHKFHK